MRNQFYGDRADIWKWSLLLELAGDTRQIYQVAMLTPDVAAHRLTTRDPGPCNELVRKFFEFERSNGSRDCYRVERLLQGRITVLNPRASGTEFYTNLGRIKYFNSVLNFLQTQSDIPKVVFLDPDNGLEIKNSTSAHVRFDDVRRTWNCLEAGDYLVVYQHHPRDFRLKKDPALLAQFLRGKKEQIGSAIQVHTDEVRDETRDSVTLFWLPRRLETQHLSVKPYQQFALPPLPELQSTSVFGQTIRYYDVGCGPALLLVHGIGGDADEWAFVLHALAASHRVIALDLPGFGRSDKPHIEYSIAFFVEMLERFLRTLSIDRVTPVGNSLGGWIAGAFALRFPERVNKLALVDAAGVWEGVTELPFDLRVSTREHLADVFRHLFYDKNLATDELIDLAYQQHLERGDNYAISSLLRNLRDRREHLDQRIAGLQVPTLIVWGENDEMIPVATAHKIQQSVPGSQLRILANCGHLPALEKPAEFVRCVLDFVRR